MSGGGYNPPRYFGVIVSKNAVNPRPMGGEQSRKVDIDRTGGIMILEVVGNVLKEVQKSFFVGIF